MSAESVIDFGTRYCPLCEKDIPAPEFGRHTGFDHSPEEIARKWPGGLKGYKRDLLESFDKSIAAASGNPQVQRQLERAKQIVTAMQFG